MVLESSQSVNVRRPHPHFLPVRGIEPGLLVEPSGCFLLGRGRLVCLVRVNVGSVSGDQDIPEDTFLMGRCYYSLECVSTLWFHLSDVFQWPQRDSTGEFSGRSHGSCQEIRFRNKPPLEKQKNNKQTPFSQTPPKQ